MMHVDADFAHYRKNAIQGSAKLRNAILKSLGHPIPVPPRQRRFKAPSFAAVNKGGRPKGSTKSLTHAARINQIKILVGRYCRVRPEKLANDPRWKYARIRQVAMYAARAILQASYPEIGKSFGKDHTTVIHSVREVQKLVDREHQETIRILKTVERGIGPQFIHRTDIQVPVADTNPAEAYTAK